jgi:nitrogen fixation protein FixH
MSSASNKAFVFTGWHMVAVMLIFFGTIISVNFFMAYKAVTSWSGFVVENTYIASQQFNGKVAQARALAATGVSGKLSVSGSEIRYEITGSDDKPVAADNLILRFKRPVGEHQDFQIVLTQTGEGMFEASRKVLPGHWIVEAVAERDGELILHQAERISVRRASR